MSLNREGHHSSARYLGSQRLDYEPVRRRGCGEVLEGLVGDRIGRAQGYSRLIRMLAKVTMGFDWVRTSIRIEVPNALDAGRAARGQIQIFFPQNDIPNIRPCRRPQCPRRNAADGVGPNRIMRQSPNERLSDIGVERVLGRQGRSRRISLYAEEPQVAHVLGPRRKLAVQPVVC